MAEALRASGGGENNITVSKLHSISVEVNGDLQMAKVVEWRAGGPVGSRGEVEHGGRQT